MTSDEMSLEAKIHALPQELQREVEDFVELLLEKRRRPELEQLAVTHGWPPGFSRTAGSIDDPTFVRHPQGEYEQRESFERSTCSAAIPVSPSCVSRSHRSHRKCLPRLRLTWRSVLSQS